MLANMKNCDLKELTTQNRRILEQFKRDGVPLGGQIEIEFICEFADALHARTCRTQLKQKLTKSRLKNWGSERLFMVSGSQDKSGSTLIVSMQVLPEVKSISEFEHLMYNVASRAGGGDVSWEFPDPRNTKSAEH
jgi:hypothetical protein